MSEFAERVYALLRNVPPGRVTTYKLLAEALGTPCYRAVGHALRNNPYAPIVPCHRVVASSGHIGGFMGKTNGPAIRKKIALLRTEGVTVRNNRVVRFSDRLFSFR